MKGRTWPVSTGLLVAVAMVFLTGGEHAAGGSAASVAPISEQKAVEASTCHSRSDCGSPVKGGLQIAFTGWSCTTGFVARHATSRKLFVLTAGHCIVSSGLSALWSHHDVDLGPASLYSFENGSSADSGAIEIGETGPADQVYGTSNDDIRTVTALVPNASQTVGSIVCRSGSTSGWGCGRIVTADVVAKIQGRLIEHTWWTDFPSASGDSGAPVLDAQGGAAGVVIATTATQTVYSTVEGIENALDLKPCLDAACD